jgi:CBS domain-containing protein
MEARDRWTLLENALEQLEHKLEQSAETLAESVRAAGHDVFQSVRVLLRVEVGLAAPVRVLMTSPVMTCSPHDDVNDVAQLFWDTNCGSLPVVDESGVLLGMLTDRDICMAAYTQGRRLPDISVASAMSARVYTASPDDSLQRVLEIMADSQVHHVPIVDADRRVVGIISLTDVARWVQSSPARSNEVQSAALSTIAAIAAPRPSSPTSAH